MHLVLAWPGIFILLGILVWSFVYARLGSERAALEQSAFKEVLNISKSYAVQLARTIEQVDQITLTLKHYWQDTNGRLNLEQKSQQGLYPASALLHVSIVDRNGRMRTSTNGRSDRSVAKRDYFQAHENDPSLGLLIGRPVVGIFSGKTVIRFSRRLNTPKGQFDGLVIVAVEPPYLASFYDESQMGSSTFLSVGTREDVLLATKMGESTGSLSTIFLSPPVFKSNSGVLALPKEMFIDNQAHIVAWKMQNNYPLVSIVGLSERAIFASYEEKAGDYRTVAIAASVFLLLSALVGMFFSARLAWRKQQEQEVKNTYRLAIDGAREGFYMLRALYNPDRSIADFLVEDCNERGSVLMGLSKESLIGANVSEVYSGAHRQHVLAVLRCAMETGFYEEEFKVPLPSPLYASWVHRKLTRSGNGLAMTLRDISKMKADEEALSYLANADAVTTLPNRHWLMNYLPLAVEQAKISNTRLGLLFVDLDDFKNINDTLGHAAGDELLQAVALRLKSVIRPNDQVARLGGDEFTTVLEHVGDNDDVCLVADRIIKSLGEPFVLSGGSSHVVRASIGISIFPQDGDNGETLLKHADIAMYAAKTNGKGYYEFYQPQLSKNLVIRLSKEQALRKAIECDELVLHYQPRVNTFSGELRSLEALARWAHPERGLVPPMEFIPVAEETGLIVPLGEQVIRKACAQLAQWKAQNLPVVPVSINVSARQFGRGNLSALFASCLQQYDIAPALIEMEITESSMMGDDKVVTEELAAIEALGVRLLVDDFGTGYSSLSQLQRLDLDILKVDRAFTAQLCDGKEGEAFFIAILSMAHALDMSVVAEGVETVQQLHLLQTLSCDEVQGNLISRPVPAHEVPGLMQKRFLFSPSHQLVRPSQHLLF